MYRLNFARIYRTRHFSLISAPKIELTKEEEKLFEVLQFIRKKYAPKSTLRVAGGWVRDKVLGIPSDDIDIALDTMTGEAFVKHILAFQNSCGVPVKGFYLVKKNAEQSKHLECAAVKLLGHELDFVHLRNETYTDPNSRIPQLSDTLATPKEDAMRRDITINALFYNLSTRTVEDFTEKGFMDLHRQVIRTPLPPTETFLDDPLRVLRAVRFACQYDFKLDAALRKSMKTDAVKTALIQKVTRERVGIEIRKMLSGANPAMAIKILSDTGLMHITFPTIFQNSTADPFNLSCISFVQGSYNKSEIDIATKDQFDYRHMLACILFQPELPQENIARSLTALLDPVHRHGCELEVIKEAITYLKDSNNELLSQANKNRMDAIKIELKWSKLESKIASDFVEAATRFLVLAKDSHHRQPTLQNVHYYLWFRAHSTRFKQVFPMLYHVAYPQETNMKPLEKWYESTWVDETKTRIQMDGRELQSLVSKSKLSWTVSELIDIIAVWEWMYPEKTLEDEKEFVHDTLIPYLRGATS